jgi:RNA polymerase sigma-70 factor, ECF subfamily
VGHALSDDDLDLARFLNAYRANVAAVYRYAHRLAGGDQPLAEDVTQDVFGAALVAWRAGRSAQVTEAWLITVARNKFVDGMRKRSREESGLEAVADTGVADATEASLDSAVVRECLAELPPLQRMVVSLGYGDDRTIAEIARLTDRSEAAVDSLLRRGLASLRRIAKEHGHG